MSKIINYILATTIAAGILSIICWLAMSSGPILIEGYATANYNSGIIEDISNLVKYDATQIAPSLLFLLITMIVGFTLLLFICFTFFDSLMRYWKISTTTVGSFDDSFLPIYSLSIIFIVGILVVTGLNFNKVIDAKYTLDEKCIKRYASTVIDENTFLVDAKLYGMEYDVMNGTIVGKIKNPIYVKCNNKLFKVTKLVKESTGSYIQYGIVNDAVEAKEIMGELSKNVDASPNVNSNTSTKIDTSIDININVDTGGGSDDGKLTKPTTEPSSN